MGKNRGNSWLNAVKKAFRSPTSDDEKRTSRRREEKGQEEDDQKKRGTKRWIFRRHFPLETTIQHSAAAIFCSGDENMVRKQPKFDVSEQRRVIAVAMATTAAAEAAVKTAQAAVDIIRLTNKPSILMEQHKAALLIQSIFRGYLARRALLALKGVVNLQALIRGHNVRKRAKMTLQCIQSLVRVQALVCDQRRRLSCEATSLGSMFRQENSGRKSSSNVVKNLNNFGVNSSEVEEIHALIQKSKECSLKQGKTLAYALSQQMWESDQEDRFSENYTHPRFRKDGNLCNQRDPIKIVEIDTSSRPYLYRSFDQNRHSMFIPSPLYEKRLNLFAESPKTPSSSKKKSIPGSPCEYRSAETPTSRSIYFHRMSMSENSCPLPRPNYMAATASAMARVRPHSMPRHRPSSPSRDQTGSARKRLSFPILDEQRSNQLHYGTE